VTLFPSILSQVQSVTPTVFLPSKLILKYNRSIKEFFFLIDLEFIDAVVMINFGLFNLLGNFLAGCIKKVS